MNRFLLFPAALLLAACGAADQTDGTLGRATTAPAADTTAAPVAEAAPTTPIPALMLESGNGQTFATTAGTFEQLPETVLPSFSEGNDGKYADSPALAQAQGVRRDGDRLLLKPANGPEVVLKNVDADSYEEFRKYRYWGELPTAHQWVLELGLYEGSATLLVDQRTGAKKYVWGTPAVSPDGHHVFTASGDLGAGYNPNGVQLYRVGPDSLTLVGERKMTKKEPYTGRWLNEHAVVLELGSADFRPGAKPALSYLGLELARRPNQ